MQCCTRVGLILFLIFSFLFGEKKIKTKKEKFIYLEDILFISYLILLAGALSYGPDFDVYQRAYDSVFYTRDKGYGVLLFVLKSIGFDVKQVRLFIAVVCVILANVVVTGWVSEQQVDTYIGKTKFLVFPSLWPETFGLNVIRALYAGIPCLVSSNTAAEDYVIEGINGFVFEQGNFQSILHYSEMMPLLNCVTAKNGNAEYMSSLY